MKLRRIPLLSILCFTLVISNTHIAPGLLAQDSQDVVAQPDPDTIPVQPFQVTGIAGAFNASFSLINESGNKHLKQEVIAELNDHIDTLFSEVDLFLGDSLMQKLEDINIRELDKADNRAGTYLEDIDQLQKRLLSEATEIENATKPLTLNKSRWQLTVNRLEEGKIPEQQVDRIDRTISRLDSVTIILQEDLNLIMNEQDRLTNKKSNLEALQVRIRDQKRILGEQIFLRDQPGFFKELTTLGDSLLVKNQMNQLKKSVQSDVEILKSEYLAPLIIISLFFIFLLIFSIWYKKHFARLIAVDKFEISEMHLTIIYSPVVAVIFVTTVMIRFVYPDLPHTFESLNLIVMMVTMLIIVIRLFGSMVRSWMQILMAIYVLSFIYELLYYPDIILRMALMILSVSGFLLFLWMIIRKPLSARFNNKFVYRLFRTLLALFTLLLFSAIIGNLLGAFRMAEFFTLIPIQVVFLSIGIQVLVKVADTIVYLLLASKSIQRLNVFREEFQVIYRKTTGFINFLLWLFFIVTAMGIFRIKEPFFEWGGEMLTTGWKIGAVDITPGSILIFIFVIWLSIFISRIVRHILEKDVFVRVSTAKGMPSTIILLVRIALITGGFFLAAAAAGMKLTNLSIVIGAFSVGIGFGLQNIFNNMVSGLILAFERPIKVGDTVQVGELFGVVLSIGFRSSTVRSFDGADVIVPNGNLISNQMINWTLSDPNRRMDIRVGVAYGTDPEKVIAIMEETASEHKQVRKKPLPKAYFLGFGDSSLDFRLLAWANIDVRLSVESELNITVNKKLGEAGIEIPFPQRDLHIRSDATKGKK